MTVYQLALGSYGQAEQSAIQVVQFDSETNQFTTLHALSGVASPSFLGLASDYSILYAISEVEQGEIISYHIRQDWKEGSRQLTGSGPCYVHINQEAGYLITANYGGGSISLHPLQENGDIQPAASAFELKNKHQDSHPHMCFPTGVEHHYFITDLAQDQIFLFQVDPANQQLIKKKAFSLIAGSGPRHLVCHPEKNLFYIIHEFNSSIAVYQYHPDEELLEWKQEVSTVKDHEKEENYCADIHLSADGQYLFASNRGRDTITSYQVLPDGRLEYLNQTSTGGKWPRNFVLSEDGRYMFIANEHSDAVSVLKIEAGRLTEITASYAIPAPTCVINLPKER